MNHSFERNVNGLVGKGWWSDEREEHREQIERFLDAMNEEKLKMNPNKLNLFAHYTRYLGCIVGRRSLCMDPQKLEAVDNMAQRGATAPLGTETSASDTMIRNS